MKGDGCFKGRGERLVKGAGFSRQKDGFQGATRDDDDEVGQKPVPKPLGDVVPATSHPAGVIRNMRGTWTRLALSEDREPLGK